ncbi:MAG: carboxypeptidase regulatory-like domain-containing protein, partial [Pyrinomonadaceae bacterium]|nr:carboxypeptidase regulatory-like domain-containing protein [Pyrinomonadaceae bacterium]
MNLFANTLKRSLSLVLLLALTASAYTVFAQQAAGTLRGVVTDEFGGVIIGATVTATDQSGTQKTATTNDDGVYTISGLAPGRYTLSVQATGFAVYENTEVDVVAGRRDTLDVKLGVTIEEQKVTVASETPVSTDPENNADQVVLKGQDLDALPDDPDELAAALQALAGPSAGPNGGQIFIDGFTGGRMPPKESIREIRINQNPFAAENDQPSGGRIDIFTKPGTDKLRGSAFFN